MFYIEKNDKPNIFEKWLKIIKIEENKIILPIIENISDKDLEKIAIKTVKKIKRNSNSKKVVLSKEMQKYNLYINYLNTAEIDILDGKWLYEILLTDIVQYIIKKKNIDIEKTQISVLINDLNEIEYENIKELSRKYKHINIITNHIEKFKKIEKQLEEEGIIINITNNKKKSLLKSKIVLNIDFPNELFNKYSINENSIIINVKNNIRINKKRFNGLNINNYEIDFTENKKDNIHYENKYYLKDIYEADFYKRQNYKSIRDKIKQDKVIVTKLYLQNSEI